MLCAPAWAAVVSWDMSHSPGRSDAANDDWVQEPDGFFNLRFGSTKEEVEKRHNFEHYGLVEDGMAEDLPYPACGKISFTFDGVPITAFLTFTVADGLNCIQGSFASTSFDKIKSAFIHLYGPPHEHSSEIREFRNGPEKSAPKGESDPNNAAVESFLWFSSRVFVSLSSHQYPQSMCGFFLAPYSYMRNRSGGDKMVAKAQEKLTFSNEEYQPPGGWSEEPDGFGELKFDATRAEVEKQIELGERTELKYSNVLYNVSLKVGVTEISGTLTFNSDRLITISGEFDKSHWDSVKSTFIALYGKPHALRREEIFELGMSETLEWSGDRRSIRLIDFPRGKNATFHLHPSFKGSTVQTTTTVELFTVPPPAPPKIGIEHHESTLVLHLPDGSALDYPRIQHQPISLSYSWREKANGVFVYDFDADTTNLASIGVGDQDIEGISDDSLSQPDGWRSFELMRTWSRIGVPRNEITRFSIESTILPGPVPLFVSRADEKPGLLSIPVTLPRSIHRAVGEALLGQGPFLNNWFVIGPAIPRGTQETYLRWRMRMWVDRYGFHFMEQLLDKTAPLSIGLEQLRPNTQLEQQIVDCLRRALQTEPLADS
jgi:hypothetical protein